MLQSSATYGPNPLSLPNDHPRRGSSNVPEVFVPVAGGYLEIHDHSGCPGGADGVGREAPLNTVTLVSTLGGGMIVVAMYVS